MIAEQLDLKKPLIFEIPNILNETECRLMDWSDTFSRDRLASGQSTDLVRVEIDARYSLI